MLVRVVVGEVLWLGRGVFVIILSIFQSVSKKTTPGVGEKLGFA